MTTTADELYALLPAVYRVRDAATGSPLRGLVAVLAEQVDVIDADIAGLYENWFIETADDWVVPYIGDLLRTRTLATAGLDPGSGLSALPRRFGQRAYVANSIGYRRRKGTAAVLEQVAFDVTGWHARAVELFQLLATTQYSRHVRPRNLATPDLRRGTALTRLDGPFDTAAHTVDVRAIDVAGDAPPSRRAVQRGRYNVPNVGLFLWRLQPYPVTDGWACLATVPADAGFTFSPLGLDAPLFNPPRTEREISHLAAEPDVPGRLVRRILADELEAMRQAVVDERPAGPGAFFRDDGVPFAVSYATAAAPADLIPVPVERISICDLSTWRRPAASRAYRPPGGGPPTPLPIEVGVDPELGRLSFAPGIDPERVVVDYSYGFSGDLGGGPYDRRDSTALWLEPREVTLQIGVTKDAEVLAGSTPEAPLFDRIGDAVAAFQAQASTSTGRFTVIAVMDSASYDEDLTGATAIEVPAGCRLAIVAADWPDDREPGTIGGTPFRTKGRVAGDKLLRPQVGGSIEVRGTAPGSAANPGELILSGLLVDGGVTVLAGNLGRLRVVDCTLVPAKGGLTVKATGSAAKDNGALTIALDRSICGPLTLPPSVRDLHVGDAIVDAAGGPAAIVATGTHLAIEQATVMGSVGVDRLDASDSIFTGSLTVTRRQEGCVRFCHVPDGSTTPRRFRCQPDLALAGQADPVVAGRIRAELLPVFGSIQYGDPDYAQLGRFVAHELRTGAENGAEMGAFCSLQQPQREANLRLALDEYLRSGLEAGIIFVT